MPTTAEQDYLKAIYHLVARDEAATVGRLAEWLAVSHPSASAMVKKLGAAGLLRPDPAGGVQLTPDGEREALRVIRRHRLLETFLVEVLRLPWDEVHEEAEILEHSLSDRLEQRIATFLGDPERDPHGDPIPPPSGRHVERLDRPLADAPPGSRVRVARVSDRDPDVLRHLAGEGLVPGVLLTVERQDPFGGPLWVRSSHGHHPLGAELVGAMSVADVEGSVA